MSSVYYAFWAFAAGALIPLMALLNAGLARTVGGQVQATVILLATGAILFAVTAQLITSALMGHFALAGASPRPLTSLRALGLLIVVAGVVITQLSDRQTGAR